MRVLPGSITSVHRYELPVPREAVWSQISDVREFRRWWPWLRACDAVALAAGEVWTCEAQPPLPYPIRFTVVIDEVEAPFLVRARVEGDVIGEAALELLEAAGGCVATLHSTLAPGNRALRFLSRVAAPIARFGHDWVLDTGARQFIARAVLPVPGE